MEATMMKTDIAAIIWTVTNGGGWSTGPVKHGVLDDRGRELGGYALVEEVPLNAAGRYAHAGDDPVVVKVVFRSRTGTTRNGKPFGAYSYGTIHDTVEEAKAAGLKKLAEQRKRCERGRK